jgi:hypothetical protein
VLQQIILVYASPEVALSGHAAAPTSPCGLRQAYIVLKIWAYKARIVFGGAHFSAIQICSRQKLVLSSPFLFTYY